jgi:PAT family beta-lactamase induction signal transducer AmpG
VIRSRRLAVLFALGFSSGLPLFLTANTLKAWMKTAQLDLGAIGAVSLIGLAYTFKFAWAPLLDRWHLPWLGRRRGWMIVTQVALGVAIAAMGAIDPARDLGALVAIAIAVAFLSASQDVVLDAYNADLLAPEERAAGAGVYVFGYRIGMLVAGSLALILADHMPWRAVYALMGALMSVGAIATLVAEEPPLARAAPHGIGEAIVRPFRDFATRLGWRGAIAALAFAALYRFGDQFAQSLVTTFLQRDFTLTEIGAINKPFGLAGAMAGAALGGWMVARHGVWRPLVLFGALQGVTKLGYVWLAAAGHDRAVFATAVFCDATTEAAAVSAFLAYLMSLCSPAVSATQFALLTSLSSVGLRVFGPFASDIVKAWGWGGYFATCGALALPGVALAIVMSTSRRRAGSPPPTSLSGAG